MHLATILVLAMQYQLHFKAMKTGLGVLVRRRELMGNG